MSTRLSFEVPAALEASEPPEARGLTRDAVRMLIAYRSTNSLVHSTFSSLPTFLSPGDLVVVNTSGTIPAAVDALSSDGTAIVVHLSTRIEDGLWVVEPRRPMGASSQRWSGEPPPRRLALVGGASVELLDPYRGSDRLWSARVEFPQPALAWLVRHGRPIHYGTLDRRWSADSYQSVYSTEPGSAEMPSAGRPFTAEVITRLVAKGVAVTPVVLHTGVSSLEADELPYPERVKVPAWTARRVNATRRDGGRVIAVGTTVVRALETAAAGHRHVEALDGWTDLVITPEHDVRAVDGLLTGWHEPEASHLMMLEAIAGRELLERSYATGLAAEYLWHEFGDTHLILP